MDRETKEEIKRRVRNTEIRVAESLLRWKYKKEGKEVPDDEDLRRRSRQVTQETRAVIMKRGKNILKELKKACRQDKTREE